MEEGETFLAKRSLFRTFFIQDFSSDASLIYQFCSIRIKLVFKNKCFMFKLLILQEIVLGSEYLSSLCETIHKTEVFFFK